MATSQNGWLGLGTSALQSQYLTTITVPDTYPVRKFRVRKGAVATVFLWLVSRFHREVESLNEGHPNDDWSFAYRSVRAGSSLSNHASGTAVDLNATQHPLGTSPTANFTSRQRTAIRKILNDADGVIRWGGDYSGRKDPMHFEINKGGAAVEALAAKISGTPVQPAWKTARYVGLLRVRSPLMHGAKYGPSIRRVQDKVGATRDGWYGAKTASKVRAWQKAHKLVADGIVGPVTWGAMF